MSERKTELGRPDSPFQAAVRLTALGCTMVGRGRITPFSLSVACTSPPPCPICMHCLWVKQVIPRMDPVLDRIAIVRVTGNSGRELFIAALNGDEGVLRPPAAPPEGLCWRWVGLRLCVVTEAELYK